MKKLKEPVEIKIGYTKATHITSGGRYTMYDNHNELHYWIDELQTEHSKGWDTIRTLPKEWKRKLIIEQL